MRNLAGTKMRRGLPPAILGILVASCGPSQEVNAGQLSAEGNDAADAVAPFAKGHGAISVDYQHLFLNGDWWDVGPKVPNGSVVVNSVTLALDYFFLDRWDVSVTLPFVSARYSGNAPHTLDQLEVPHPHAVYVDDGAAHGTWADWSLGVGYHADWGGYFLTPSVTAYVPSHQYSFYGAATVGDDVAKIGFGVELSHQLELSDLFFDIHYQYVIAQETLGIRPNYSAFGFDVGYFLNPRTQIRAFTDGRLGKGATDTTIGEHCPPCTDEFWYEHDKFRLEEHFNVGAALDYQLGDRYTLSTSVQRMVWGKSNLDLKYGFDLRLARSF